MLVTASLYRADSIYEYFKCVMGSGSSKNTISMENNLDITSKLNGNYVNRNFVVAYENLDVEICNLESKCPGPRLVTAEAWFEFLRQEFDTEEIKTKHFLNDTTANISSKDNGFSQKVNEYDLQDEARLALQLGVLVDSNKAIQQEDFFADISKRALAHLSKQFYLEITNSASTRVKNLLQQYKQLTDLYSKQDALIVSRGVYLTEIEERLDTQLEEERSIRDRLGNTMEQWRTAAFLLIASMKSSLKAVNIWKSLRDFQPAKMIHSALESRKAVLAALILLECAQVALTSVHFKHIPFQRQKTAVMNVSTFMLTDIASEKRYQQTLNILAKFYGDLSQSLIWFRETYETTLKKDFQEIDQKIKVISQNLRQHRVEMYIKAAIKKQIF